MDAQTLHWLMLAGMLVLAGILHAITKAKGY